jgi:hypothetical protein
MPKEGESFLYTSIVKLVEYKMLVVTVESGGIWGMARKAENGMTASNINQT